MVMWEKFLIIIIIVIAILVIILFSPQRNVQKRKENRYRLKSSADNVRMKLSSTRKMATFSISLNRSDIKSAYIMSGQKILADITSDFVQNSGVANGFWRLTENEANLLERGAVNIKVIFEDEGTISMTIE
jgi:hypothetical protein